MVLVSLLVDQFSGLFLIFFGRPKKNLSSIRFFCSLSWIFCPVFFENVVLVSLLADQLSGQFLIFWKRLDKKFKRVNKKDLILDKFFFGRPKKMRNRLDNWSTKRLTKTTWTGLVSIAKPTTLLIFLISFSFNFQTFKDLQIVTWILAWSEVVFYLSRKKCFQNSFEQNDILSVEIFQQNILHTTWHQSNF